MVTELATSIGTGVRHSLITGGEYVVAEGARIISDDNLAIQYINSSALGLTLSIAGLVQSSSGNNAVALTSNDQDAQDNMAVFIARTGVVNSPIQYGFSIEAFAGDNVTLRNDGVISARRGIVLMTGSESASILINNTGTIVGSQTGVYDFSSTNNGTYVLRNSGKIIGGTEAIGMNNTKSQVFNSGLILGAVSLSDQDDLYDGRGGQVIGLINGEDGDDRFIPGAARDSIAGGLGEDVLDFRSTKGVKVALDGGFAGTGAAKGDTYTSIENIYGSLKGSDRLQGDAARNDLYGYGGADTLSGGAERDALTGGAGRDRLTGGDGTDYFLFNRAREGGDVITDFQGSGPTLDYLILELSGFGLSGPFQQGWYREGRTNQARDRDDHFIFRKTDTTLWFDADGRGGRGPVLLANLQAGAELDWTQFNPIIT